MKKIIYTIEAIIIVLIVILIIFIYTPSNILIAGEKYDKYVTNIDLSNSNLDEDFKWKDKLSDFPKLEKVNINNKLLNKNDKEELETLYPNITFEMELAYEIYGKIYNENTETIDLSDVKIDEKLFDYLLLFVNLRSVNLMNNFISLDDMHKLRITFPNVNFEWDIYYDGNIISKEIEKLDLSNQKNINKKELEYLLFELKNLKELIMSDTNLNNEELAELRKKFPKINIIWKLYLGKWSLMTNDVSFSVLVGKINYKRMTSEDIEVLKYCTNLKALDLGHQAIEDISVIGDYLKDLRILILADNKIENIAPLKNLKHLHYLELFVNKIEDFSPLGELDELIDINIGYNKINDINPLLNFKHIERLWIVNGGLSENDRVVFKSKYPNAIVNTSWALTSTGNGWRKHPRYHAMIDMFNKKDYMSEEFSKYDDLQ